MKGAISQPDLGDLMIESEIIQPWVLTDQIVGQLTASLGLLSNEECWQIARDVPSAARQVLNGPARVRRASILRELKELKKKLQRGDSGFEVSDDLWPALRVGDEYEIESLLSSPESLGRALEAAIPEFQCMPETVIDRGGGRRRDPRIDRFAYRLGLIYVRHLHVPPTFTQDTETGWAVSPFAFFGDEAFRLFCPIQCGEGQIREALRLRRPSKPGHLHQ